jgi:predicted NAD/FAD-binding protein
MENPRPKTRVLIIGGGSAGTAAAYSLSRSPDKFDVSLWEAAGVLGGVATSENLNLPDGTTVRINDGVQGGSLSYRNIHALHSCLGLPAPHRVNMTVTFGKGKWAWSNIGPETELVCRLRPEIARFESVLRWVDRMALIFAFVPIRRVLKLWGFANEFGERMVYPLTALFFGTGNRTPEVSAAIIARVFLDPQLRLFDYSPERLLSTAPEMFAFQTLGDMYETMAKKLRGAGVDVSLSRPVSTIERRPGSPEGEVVATDASGKTVRFDKVIFACDAETALRLLKDPTYWEKKTLGAVRYYDDVTITHCDSKYMNDHYEMPKEPQATEPWRASSHGGVHMHVAQPGSNFLPSNSLYAPMRAPANLHHHHVQAHTAQANNQSALHTSSDTRSDYFIYTDEADPSKLEMSFDLGHYQPHLKSRPRGSCPIYQTIFLDRQGCEQSWTIKSIDPKKILLTKWWRQFSHEASHFTWVVPFVRAIQGAKKGTTFYAGSWTLVNTHEIACVSGLAAAYRLGAKYPFDHDKLAASQFDSYLGIAHGASRSACCGLFGRSDKHSDYAV